MFVLPSSDAQLRCKVKSTCDDGDARSFCRVVQRSRDRLVQVEVQSVELVRSVQGQGSNPVRVSADELKQQT